MEDEPGSAFVEQVLNDPKILRSNSLARSLRGLLHNAAEKKAKKRRIAAMCLLKELPAEIVWAFDEPRLLSAARIKARFPLSFADSIIAVTAERERAVLVHKDPEFAALEGTIRLRSLPYKN